MILNKEYIEEKNKELKLLNYENKLEYKTFTKLYLKKLKQQVKLKNDFLKEIYDCQNTCRNEQFYKKDKLIFDYEYQRYDINIKQNNFFKKLYNLSEEEDNYYFTNSGMSGLSSVFYALKKLGYKVTYKSNIYVETERLLNDYIFNEKENKYSKEALFLDSVSFTNLEVFLNKDILNYDLYIVDTTLYIKDELDKIITFFQQKNKTVILIKSHTKMDMLGIEWSTLGSIYIISNNTELKSTLMKEIKIVLSFIGGFAYPTAIPLYWSKDEFYTINYNRNKRIKKNTDYIYDILKNKFHNLDIVKPYNKMFILIKPNRFIDYKKIEKDLHKYTINSKYKNIVCYADSFGADYLGISGYYENMSADTEVIRISTGDLPTPLIKEVIEEFMQWLEVYL